jgi:1-acyl-sn-glycerol-3-phosphate acyltransferase
MSPARDEAERPAGSWPQPRPPTWPRRLAARVLALVGWRTEVVWPPGPKCVLVVYPHTSNWDFVVGYLAKLAVGLPAHFIGKDALFRWPLGILFRAMGGFPVNRRESTGLVGALKREMDGRSWMWLAVAPEGTRKFTDHWRSGFYHLALAAKIPIGLVYLDYRRRVLGISTYLTPSGDEEADLEAIRRAYAGVEGCRPAQASTIRFRREPDR